MDQTQDLKSLQDKIQVALISTTRTSGQIASEDLGFQRSLNPEFGDLLDEQSSRLLTLSTSLLKSAASIAELNVPALEDVEDVENNWRSVVDVLDSLLEKTDTCLDEYTGVIKRKESSTTSNLEVRIIIGLWEYCLLIMKCSLRQKQKVRNKHTPWAIPFELRISSNRNLLSMSNQTIMIPHPGSHFSEQSRMLLCH